MAVLHSAKYYYYYYCTVQLFADLPALSSFDIGENQMSGDISGLKFKSNTINLVRLYI